MRKVLNVVVKLARLRGDGDEYVDRHTDGDRLILQGHRLNVFRMMLGGVERKPAYRITAPVSEQDARNTKVRLFQSWAMQRESGKHTDTRLVEKLVKAKNSLVRDRQESIGATSSWDWFRKIVAD